MDGWKITFLLGRPIFRGELLVSGSVYQLGVKLSISDVDIDLERQDFQDCLTFLKGSRELTKRMRLKERQERDKGGKLLWSGSWRDSSTDCTLNRCYQQGNLINIIFEFWSIIMNDWHMLLPSKDLYLLWGKHGFKHEEINIDKKKYPPKNKPKKENMSSKIIAVPNTKLTI